MGNETVIIDIDARFTDQTSSGVNKATQNVDKFTQSTEKAKKKAKELGMTKVDIAIKAVDKASSVLNKIKNVANTIVRKPFQLTVSVIDKVTAPLRKLYNFAFSLKGLLTGIVLGKAGQELVSQPIGLADQMEGAMIFFEKKLGSLEAANQMIKDIQKFDEKSPFNSMQIIQRVQNMMGVGWSRETVLSDLQAIGDAASALSLGDEGIASIVRQMGQIKAKGKMQGEELMVLRERGLEVDRYLAEGFGVAKSEISKMQEKGKLDAEKGIQYILEGFRRDYGDSAEANADRTISGIWGRIESVIESKIKLPWGQGLAEGAKKGLSLLANTLDKYGAKFEQWGSKLKVVGEQISMFLAETVQGTLEKAEKLFSSDAFKNASLGGKAGMIWDEIIAKPAADWWESSGKEKVGKIAKSIGSALAEGIVTGLSVAGNVAFSNPITGAIATMWLGGKGLGAASSILKGVKGTQNFIKGAKAGSLVASGMAGPLPTATLTGAGAVGAKVGGALTSVGSALAAIPGWGWAAAAALVAVGGGIALYNKYKKEEEKRLLETGKRVKEQADAYKQAEESTNSTTKLIEEYRAAVKASDEALKDANKTEEEKKKLQDDVASSLEKLKELYPKVFEGGKTPEEAIAAIEKMIEKEKELARIRLVESYEKEKGNIDKLKKTYSTEKDKYISNQSIVNTVADFKSMMDDIVIKADKIDRGNLSQDEKDRLAAEIEAIVSQIKTTAQNSGNAHLQHFAQFFDPMVHYRNGTEKTGITFETMSGRYDALSTLTEQYGEAAENAKAKMDAAAESLQKLADTETIIREFGGAASEATVALYLLKGGHGPLNPRANGTITNGPEVALIGEAGPEAIIPLSATRRSRGLALWQRAGRMLGVNAYADGGIVGTSSSSGSGIVVQLGGMNFTITGGGDAQSIMTAIKEQMPTIANEVASAIATKLSRTFSNMPLSEGGV